MSEPECLDTAWSGFVRRVTASSQKVAILHNRCLNVADIIIAFRMTCANWSNWVAIRLLLDALSSWKHHTLTCFLRA